MYSLKRNLILIAAGVITALAGIVLVVVLYPQHPATQSLKPIPIAKQDDTSAKTGFDKKKYSTAEPSSPWVVVNKQHPVNPASYAPADLTAVGNGQEMRAEAAAALLHMFADAQTAGYTLVPDSAYRSYNTQVSTYNGYVKSYGQAKTDTFSARPGYSEHQTGWAVDVGADSCHVEDCFADTPGGKWAAANAYKYGFILRYPASLTDVTGYTHEAWHFRYIGPVLAEELHAKNIQTLEQFFGISGGTTYK